MTFTTNTTAPDVSQVAQSVQDLVAKWSTFFQQQKDWLGGTATGGPNGDGRYPLTDFRGNTVLVPCPAAEAARVDGEADSALAYANSASASATAANTYVSNAQMARDAANSFSQAAIAARDLAQMYANEAGSSAALALQYSQQAAQSASDLDQAVADAHQTLADTRVSEQNAADSASAASGSATDAAASAAAAAESASHIGNWDPANYYLKVASDARFAPIAGPVAGWAVGTNLTVSGTSTLTGATTVGSTLGVTGKGTFNTDVTVGGVLGVTGAATFNSTLGVTGAVTFGSTLGVTGGLTVGASNAKPTQVTINGSAGQTRTLTFSSSGVPRWGLGADGVSEATGNVGSNFNLSAYSDDGATASTVLGINRSTRLVTFSVRPSFNGATPWDTANFDPTLKANVDTPTFTGLAYFAVGHGSTAVGRFYPSGTNGVSVDAVTSDHSAYAPLNFGATQITFTAPNVNSTGILSVRDVQTNGWVQMVPGSASFPGYMSFYTADSIRRGFIGWGTGTQLQVAAENGWSWTFSGNVNFNNQVNALGGLHSVNSNTAFNGQGAYLGWNRNYRSGNGETDFINHHGGGSGGWAFIDTDGTTYWERASISGNGAFYSGNSWGGPGAGVNTMSYQAVGNYGGGYGITDGAYNIGLFSIGGALQIGFATNGGAFTSAFSIESSGTTRFNVFAPNSANGAYLQGNGSGIQYNGTMYNNGTHYKLSQDATAWVREPRVFVQGNDPGGQASDGDVWIW